jgi:hypothetical protein
LDFPCAPLDIGSADIEVNDLMGSMARVTSKLDDLAKRIEALIERDRKR